MSSARDHVTAYLVHVSVSADVDILRLLFSSSQRFVALLYSYPLLEAIYRESSGTCALELSYLSYHVHISD